VIGRLAYVARFWAKVAKGAPDECWLWTGAKADGYGRLCRNRNWFYAHRVSFGMAGNVIPDGLQLDHLCRNRSCVNPVHLEVVSNWENTLRGQNHAAKLASVTHCPHGHPYDPTNTYVGVDGHRRCRACRRFNGRRYRASRLQVVVQVEGV